MCLTTEDYKIELAYKFLEDIKKALHNLHSHYEIVNETKKYAYTHDMRKIFEERMRYYNSVEADKMKVVFN